MKHLYLFVLLLGAGVARADVPTVENPREAPLTRTVSVRELWRVGADEDAEYVFGTIVSAVSDADGVIHLLDSQTQTLHAFGPEGDYRGATARSGEGPGEIHMVYDVMTWDDDHVACLQVFPARIVVVGTDGTPGTTIDLRLAETPDGMAFVMASDFARLGDTLVGSGNQNVYDEDGQHERTYLASFHPTGEVRHVFGIQDTGYDFSRPILVDEAKDYVPWHRWCLGPDGEVYVAPARDAYLIEVRDLDGNLLRRITRDAAPRRRTVAEKERVKRDYSFGSEGELPGISYRIADHAPPLHGLEWRDGMLWVRTTRGWEEGFPSYDIYDAAGSLVEERRYDVPLDREDDNLVILSGDRLVRIANLRAATVASNADMTIQMGEDRVDGSQVDEDAVLEVILYEVAD